MNRVDTRESISNSKILIKTEIFTDINLYIFVAKRTKSSISQKKKTNDILPLSMRIYYFVLCRLMHIQNVFLRDLYFTLIFFCFSNKREILFTLVWKH